jgi:glycosyltransferase involved in cell wall biosynthesis
VVTVHDLAFARFPEWVDDASLAYRTLVPRALSRAAAILTPSHAIAMDLEEQFQVPSDRITVTPLGVADAWFDIESYREPVDTRDASNGYLVAVGTLQPRKGLDVLLDAYRSLIGQDPTTPPLVLVGPSGWGPSLDRAGLPPERVIVPGYISEARLRRLVARARMLIFPSRYEGFGLPPLEALAAGTPVVSSDLAPIREVVGRHAMLVPPGDAGALSHAIACYLDRPPSPSALAEAREHARTFTWQRCVDATEAVYRKVLDRS